MQYQLNPQPKSITYEPGLCDVLSLQNAICAIDTDNAMFEALPTSLRPQSSSASARYEYSLGKPEPCCAPNREQGYAMRICAHGVTIRANDALGLRYGVMTFAAILRQCSNGKLPCALITDWPELKHRGLMLDVSRGKVYTLDYLLGLIDLLSKLRYNVLQLYIEHTFDFSGHPEISEGSDPLTKEDIRTLQAHCTRRGIELQANLQCLGHCRRILTRREHMALAESDMYWSLCTTSDNSLRLIDEMFSEYLPLFDSPWVNICFDEPYDIGKGKSAHLHRSSESLYIDFLLKVSELAKRYGKKVMVFGDVFIHNPAYLDRMPKNIIYLDWCYDPKPVYGTPALFRESGATFWVCPGTGNWNTLFPRLDGAITNVVNLVQEGVAAKADGMLFTDWNDHGGYTQPAPSYYLYTYAALTSWNGCDPGSVPVDTLTDDVLSIPGFSSVVHVFAEIYHLPPIWSKNRSECVMALFDEPIFGKAVSGDEPPAGLVAYDLNLPIGVEPVFERHSQHPLRPYYRIPEATLHAIDSILKRAAQCISALPDSCEKRQFSYIADAFTLMKDKLLLSSRIIGAVRSGAMTQEDFLLLEDQLRIMIKRFVHLQLAYVDLWHEIARWSEIEISLTYFAHIISRIDYLRDWLSLQRESHAAGKGYDTAFATYETGGYETLPTY